MAVLKSRTQTGARKPPKVTEVTKPRVWTNGDGSQGIAWLLSYKDPDNPKGPPLRPQFPTKAERTRERLRIEQQLNQNTYNHDAETMTLAELAWAHLADKEERGIGLGRRRGMEQKYRLHILGGHRDTPRGKYLYLGDAILTKIMPKHINAWKKEIQGKLPDLRLIRTGPKKNRGEQKPRTRALIADVGVELRSLLERAVEQRLISYNPARGVDFTDAEVKQESGLVYAGIHFMTPNEAAAILNYVKYESPDIRDGGAGGRWYPILATYMYGGLRTGELRALRASELNFADNRINVRHAISAGTTKRGPTKSSAGNRDVPLLPPLSGILKEWLDKTPRAGGIWWRIEQTLKAQPDLTRVSDFAIAAALGSPGDSNIRQASWRLRQKLGLPSYRNGNFKSLSAVVPLGLPEDGSGELNFVFPSLTGRVLTHSQIKFKFRDVQRALGMIRRDSEGNPILAKDGLPLGKYHPHSCRHFYV
jgi:integrase